MDLTNTDQLPHLTIIAPSPLYPPLSGGSAHVVNAVRELSQHYAVRLYVLADDPTRVTWGPLAEWCVETRAFTPTPHRGISFNPPAVHLAYSAALGAHLAEVWTATPPDVVQCEFTATAQYAVLARHFGAVVVCTAHNVATLAQVRRARLQPGLKLRARRWLGAISLALYEWRALRRCDLVITHSAADAAVLRRWLPRIRSEYVPSGIDLATWPICRNPNATDEVLFVGNYLHPPNAEGALWLAREVWPLVRRQRPAARLTLAGRGPTAAIQALAAADIRVPGTVDDLHDLYRASSVVVAPIFWGSGVRIKIIEALACGLPLVATPLAAEGIDLIHETSVLFAADPAQFAAAIIRLLDDSGLRQRLGNAGRTIIERDYDWRSIGARLAQVYAEVRGKQK